MAHNAAAVASAVDKQRAALDAELQAMQAGDADEHDTARLDRLKVCRRMIDSVLDDRLTMMMMMCRNNWDDWKSRRCSVVVAEGVAEVEAEDAAAYEVGCVCRKNVCVLFSFIDVMCVFVCNSIVFVIDCNARVQAGVRQCR